MYTKPRWAKLYHTQLYDDHEVCWNETSNATSEALCRTARVYFVTRLTATIHLLSDNCCHHLLLLLLLSLPSAYADDEVSTSLLHLLRSLARTVAVVKSSLHSSKSSLTLSIYFFLCRPLLLFPWRALSGNLFPSIRVTWPNHVSLRFLNLSITVSFKPSCCLISTFLFLSIRETPSILLIQLISAARIKLKLLKLPCCKRHDATCHSLQFRYLCSKMSHVVVWTKANIPYFAMSLWVC